MNCGSIIKNLSYKVKCYDLQSRKCGNVVINGIMLLPFYLCTQDGASTSCIVYSTDNGKTYHRTSGIPKTDDIKWSGENKIVALSGTLWRVFFRNDTLHICYADYHADTQIWDTPVIIPEILVHSDCNFSAILFGDKILVSYCAGEGPLALNRLNGTLYEFEIRDDSRKSLAIIRQTQFASCAFSYSDLAQINDSTVAVLWDTCGDGYEIFEKLNIAQ